MENKRFTFSTRANPPSHRPAEMRCVGRFVISTSIINRFPAAVRAVLRDMIVLRAEMRYDIDGIEYIGVHDAFDPVPEGMLPLDYEATVTENEIGDLRAYEVKWMKR